LEFVSDLRLVMRRWVSGVTILTTVLEGHKHGMTLDSFTSVSLTPPMVCFTIANTTRMFGMVSKSGIVGITLLHQGQQDLSEWFAGRSGDADRFSGVKTFTLKTGVPLISEGMAYIEFRIVHRFDMPASTLFVAELVTMAKEEDIEPLVYFNRNYHRMENESKSTDTPGT